jgi:hypothetical protein
LASSWILKRFRSISKNPIFESMIIFCFAYLSYIMSELTKSPVSSRS